MTLEILETERSGLEGNTKSNPPVVEKDTSTLKSSDDKKLRELKKKQDIQRKYWAFTLFYETETEVEIVETALQESTDKFIIGRETCPTTNRKHLQGFIAFKGKGKRFSQIKNMYKWHLEACKGTEEQNIKYCSKEKNYTTHGYPLPVRTITNLRPYQQAVVDIVKSEPDERVVHWFYDLIGNVGKSALCKYLIVKHNAILITNGKKADIANIIFNAKNIIETGKANTVVIDIPRSEHNTCSYNAIEEIKNGMIVNTKYETGSFVFNSPHVLVFSNFYPDVRKLSMDRWRIYNINSKYESVIEKSITTIADFIKDNDEDDSEQNSSEEEDFDV